MLDDCPFSRTRDDSSAAKVISFFKALLYAANMAYLLVICDRQEESQLEAI